MSFSRVAVLVMCLRSHASAENASSQAVHCAARGGCDCECGWANPSTCAHDDGSCCHGCCCSSPAPTPGPTPPGPPHGTARYCPNGLSDFNIDYGGPQLSAGGWHIQGGARVSSKASFNFAGGFLEFDMDLSNAHGNVNNNFYMTFPRDGRSYCDSGGSCSSCCAEMDFTENNGNCWQATTWHGDRGGHDHDGEAQQGGINGQVHIRAAWNADGTSLGVDVNGDHHSGEGFADVMSQVGGVLYSSQWTGWVPGSCGGDGNLGSSSFSVSNIKIQASVVQGPEPQKCSQTAVVV